MPYRVKLRSDLGLVVLRWSGDITQNDVERAFAEMPEMDGFRAGLNLLSDARGCTTDLGWWQVRHLAAFARARERAWGSCKWATVVSSDLIYGLARIYVTLASGGEIRNQVFRDPLAALAWLEADGDAAALLDQLAEAVAASEAPADPKR